MHPNFMHTELIFEDKKKPTKKHISFIQRAKLGKNMLFFIKALLFVLMGKKKAMQ